MTTLSGDMIDIDVDQAVLACRQALMRAHTPAEIADRVASSLIANEAAGSPSHGLLRLGDYLDHIHAGLLDAAARPTVSVLSDHVRVVDGRGGFGVPAADAVAASLCDMLSTAPLCAVTLVNAGHTAACRTSGKSWSATTRRSSASSTTSGAVNASRHGRAPMDACAPTRY
jgi:LDH2 family malate/lactate/ureidoglycolate dehydrogenase